MARTPVDVEDQEVDEPLSMRWTTARIAGVAAMLVVVAFWAWIFSGVLKKENPDRLDDRAFVERTERRCQQLRRDLDELPNAALLDDPDRRADVLDEANVLVTKMVDAIEADAPTTGDDARSVRGWIADWRIYLENRHDYAERLHVDPEARLLLDENPGRDPIDRGIEVFAQVNGIPDCATPGDVG